MNQIMAIRCPSCDEVVQGSNSEDLSRSIKTHFADAHNMDIEVEMNTSDEGCGCGSEPEGPGNEAAGGSGQRERSSSLDDQTFECPVCNRDIAGSDEDERTANFREHLSTTHKDEPFVTQMMETMSNR